MTNMVGNRTLQRQWNETAVFYSQNTFLEFVSVKDEVTSFTYAEFDKLVKKAANLFISMGIKKGELIAVHLHNTPMYLVCWLALAQAGAVTVPLNEHYKLEESSYIIRKCGIRRVIAEPRSVEIYTENRDALELDMIFLTYMEENLLLSDDVICISDKMNQYPDTLETIRTVSPDDIAVILFTSGTTCHPKGAIYTHCNVVYGGLLHAAQVAMEEGDRFLSSMPCYHMDFQEMAAMPVICIGGTLIMVEHYSARLFWSQVYRYKAHYTDTMSIMNRTMMMQPAEPWEKEHCLKQIYFSMGLSNEEKEQFEERFRVKLLNSYGMTETVSAVTCSPLYGDRHWPSVGRAALSYDIKIIDEDGMEVPPGTIGEICVRGIPGVSIIPGYYLEPDATAKLIDSENWLHSGDKGYLDEGGWLYFVDRYRDMIKRSGENISSSEVECILTSHPEIADAAVIGVPDSIRGWAVKAFILTVEGANLNDESVIDYCTKRLAKFKIPTVIEFVKDFPRTSTGKIKKHLLK